MSRLIAFQLETKPVDFEKKRYLDFPLVSLQRALEPIEPYIKKVQDHGRIALERCHYPSEHGLTREESAAIYLYSMETIPDNFYRLFNRVLRTGNADSIQPWCLYLKIMIEALNKLPPVQRSVWRGGSAGLSGEFREGQQLRWSCFTSCSLSLPVTKHFLKSQGTLFMIEVTSAKDISKYAMMPEEKEVLLTPGTPLTVVSNSMEINGDVQVVHLKETLPNDKSVVLIGIAGPNGCSRKVYANHLAEKFNSPFEPLRMKSFWRRKVNIEHPKCGKIKSGELPESHDVEGFAATLRQIRLNPSQTSQFLTRRQRGSFAKPIIIIVDGILTFGLTNEITSMFDIRIFIEGDLEKCRLARYLQDKGVPSNPNVNIPKEWQQYYDDVIWYEYLKRRDEQEKYAGKVFQDHYADERDFDVRDAFVDESLKKLLK